MARLPITVVVPVKVAVVMLSKTAEPPTRVFPPTVRVSMSARVRSAPTVRSVVTDRASMPVRVRQIFSDGQCLDVRSCHSGSCSHRGTKDGTVKAIQNQGGSRYRSIYSKACTIGDAQQVDDSDMAANC